MAYENMSGNITRPTVDNHHALLFVGVCNRERYVLSLIRWTNLLHEMYGYALANIRIIVGPYSNPGWASMVAGTDVTYNATRADLDNAMAAYAAGSTDPHELGADDNLFIFTFNHGGQDGSGCYLCCDSFTEKYYASDFATRIAAIHCRQIVLLAGQCHAGGFVDPFINNLWSGTRGAVMAGCRSDQNTYEAVFDKLFASAFNGRMVQNALDDNIDLGITGNGVGVTLIPGYHTKRIDWGPTGVLSMREAFNWVYDHYINSVRPAEPQITEIPLYKQYPWTDAGQPLHIRMGEPDLVVQDCAGDAGAEPSVCTSPWHSPDVYADNTDQFPTTSQNEYVPAHDNRFLVRTANRGTAPTDDVWRIMEVRGLGFTGGPVGPPRIDRAVETSGSDTVPVRLRPGRAHTQYQRIFIGGDFGHGCVSVAAKCLTDAMSHSLWNITADNDQAQCNLNPAMVSGTVSASGSSTNSNAGTIVRSIPIMAEKAGTFKLMVGKLDGDLPVKFKVTTKQLMLRKGQDGELRLELSLKSRIKDGAKGVLPVNLLRNDKVIGGMTFLVEVATAYMDVAVFDTRGLPVAKAEVILRQPGDPRMLTAGTNRKGGARFGPLNPGFYFAEVAGNDLHPLRIHVAPDGKHYIKLIVEKLPEAWQRSVGREEGRQLAAAGKRRNK
ncbi:MAG: hypothetical protein KAR40_00010 [Candidatus Sabulitectum sp.]|nr:hypothetical protein [Candidatus Sabulitectum sp.]